MKQLPFNIFLAAMVIATLFTSCLKKDLPTLPLADGNDILLASAEYRFNGSQTMNGQPVVVYQKLDASNEMDTDKGTIKMSVTIPAANGDFTDEERAKVTINSLWLYFNISPAATMKGINGTPNPGDPTDCSQPLTYEVTATNGTKQVWTITVQII